MRVLVTGSNGFIGRNLIFKLESLGFECIKFTRNDSLLSLESAVIDADFIFHLAGVNRPKKDLEFLDGNHILTEKLCNACLRNDKRVPIVYTSSTQAVLDNPYGISKSLAEKALVEFQKKNHSTVIIYRLTNVFGKWSLPYSNSVVATFCHNVAYNIPLTIHDPSSKIKLIYIDRVIESFIERIGTTRDCIEFPEVDDVFEISVGRLAELIKSINNGNWQQVQSPSEEAFMKDLQTTYFSFLQT